MSAGQLVPSLFCAYRYTSKNATPQTAAALCVIFLDLRMQKTLNRNQLEEWLKKAFGVTVLSVSLVGQVADIRHAVAC